MNQTSPDVDQAPIAALVETYWPLVEHVVRQVSTDFPRHADRDELDRAGAYGLFQAAQRFDPARGVSFKSYASHRIRGAVLDAARAADWAPRSVRRAARAIEIAQHVLAADLGHTPTDTQLAAHLRIDVGELAAMRADAVRGVVLAFDETASQVGGDATLGDTIVDRTQPEPCESLEAREVQGYLHDAVALLPEKHRTVIQGTYLDGRTSQDVADELGVSVARVSQLRGEALAMLREGLEAQYDGTAQLPVPAKGRVARRKATFAAAIAARSTWRDRLASQADDRSSAEDYA
jgi:RNA polymerase sigma factor for flagellar operon FliA